MSTVPSPEISAAPASSANALLRTLVLCDLADSTALVERLGDQRAAAVMRRHDRLARDLVHQHGGQEIDKTDGFLVMFERPIHGVAFALEYQRELRRLGVDEELPLRARVGIHVGDVMVWENAADDVAHGAKPVEVEGLVKPVAARLAGLALPGQILTSAIAAGLAQRAHGELEAADASRWVNHGRYRFKGVPDAVQVYEIGEVGVAPLKLPPWSSKAQRDVPWWRSPSSMAVEAIAVLAVIATSAWFVLRAPPAIAFAERDWVVIGTLQNHTGQKLLDDSLQTAFRIGLEQSRYVNVLPDLQVRETLKLMEREPTTPLDRAVGAEIAQREGAKAIILPSVAEIGGRVRVTAEIVDPTSQNTVYSDVAEGQGLESVLPSTDALLAKLRGRLGESLASIGTTSVPLARATTANMDALKAYSLGLKSYADGKNGDAIALFEQATKQDPEFSLAYLGLANLYYSAGQRGKAREYVELATKNQQRLSARERLMADGYMAFFQKPATLRERWSMFAKLYPDVMSGQQNLALGMWWFDNDLAEAAKNFAEVTQSRHPLRGMSWLLLGDVQLAQEQYDQARTSYAKARQVGSPQAFLNPLNWYIARRDAAGFEKAAALEPVNHFPFFEVEKALRTAAMEVSRGRYASAADAAKEAVQIADTNKLETSLQRARLVCIAIELARGVERAGKDLHAYVESETARMAHAVETADPTSYVHLTSAAMLALRHGEEALGKSVLRSLESPVSNSGYFDLEQPYKVATCEAQIASDAAAALACLQPLVSPRAFFQTRVALMRAALAADKPDEALQAALWLAANRGNATAEWLEEFVDQVPNLIGSDEAAVTAIELQEKAGNRDAARRGLTDFLQAWSQADADSPLLARAQAVQTRLASAK